MYVSNRSWEHGRSSMAHWTRVLIHATRRTRQTLHRLYLRMNPNRAELEAFRRIVVLESKLVDYPHAVPVLERLMSLYRLTGEEERRLEMMRRLRDEPELPNFPPPALTLSAQRVPSRESLVDAYYPCAKDFVRRLGFCSPTQLMMEFHVGYNVACGICDRLTQYGVIEPLVPGQPCQALRGGVR